MFNKLWEVSISASTLRAFIFTLGHFIIDVFVIASITGAAIGTATLASLIGPSINGAWFWVIDRWWSQKHANSEIL